MKGLICFLCMNAKRGAREDYSATLSNKIHVPSGRDKSRGIVPSEINDVREHIQELLDCWHHPSPSSSPAVVAGKKNRRGEGCCI